VGTSRFQFLLAGSTSVEWVLYSWDVEGCRPSDGIGAVSGQSGSVVMLSVWVLLVQSLRCGSRSGCRGVSGVGANKRGVHEGINVADSS